MSLFYLKIIDSGNTFNACLNTQFQKENKTDCLIFFKIANFKLVFVYVVFQKVGSGTFTF